MGFFVIAPPTQGGCVPLYVLYNAMIRNNHLPNTSPWSRMQNSSQNGGESMGIRREKRERD